MSLILNDTYHFQDILPQLNSEVETVVFQHTNAELLKADLSQLIDWENTKFKTLPDDSKESIKTLNIVCKSLSLDLKIEVFKYILQVPELVNSALLLNILMLISSNTKYQEDEVYQNDVVIFGSQDNGLEEFLDIKIAIKEELNQFLQELVRYYLSCLCSLHYKETDIAYDSLQILPVKYHQLLTFLTFDELSRLSRHIQELNKLDLLPIYNAKSILTSLIINQYPVMNFLESFQNIIRTSNE